MFSPKASFRGAGCLRLRFYVIIQGVCNAVIVSRCVKFHKKSRLNARFAYTASSRWVN